jgi:hypothetical protein
MKVVVYIIKPKYKWYQFYKRFQANKKPKAGFWMIAEANKDFKEMEERHRRGEIEILNREI